MRILLPALFALLLAGCSKPMPTEAEALTAVENHLAKRTDLNFGAMKLTVEKLEQQDDAAMAEIGFIMEGSEQPAMTMNYRLVREDSGWRVEAANNQVAPPAQSGQGGGLPPNHPPVGTEPQQSMPPNHPPVE